MADTTKQRRTDEATRMIASSPQKIYKAFLDPKAWVQWLPPEGMTGKVYEFDPRPGGVYRMELTYPPATGTSYGKTSENADVVEGRFVELVLNERVVHLVTFESDNPAFAGEMKMTWRVSPTANDTQVTITCENVPEGISKEDHDAGLQSTLSNLAKFIE